MPVCVPVPEFEDEDEDEDEDEPDWTNSEESDIVKNSRESDVLSWKQRAIGVRFHVKDLFRMRQATHLRESCEPFPPEIEASLEAEYPKDTHRGERQYPPEERLHPLHSYWKNRKSRLTQGSGIKDQASPPPPATNITLYQLSSLSTARTPLTFSRE